MRGRFQAGIAAFGLAVIVLLGGCEVGVNPFLLDGAPLSTTFTANTTGNIMGDSVSIALRNVLTGVDLQVDSVTVFNITLHIDNFKNGTPPGAMLTGIGGIDGDTLLTLINVPLSTFATERSIFDPSLKNLPGGATCAYHEAGVSYLNRLLKHPESLPPSVSLKVGGIANQNGLYFDVTMKLYTQIFVKSSH
jgi:hypothetical protein